MEKLPHDVFVEIVGSPFLERAIEYKAAFVATTQAWCDYAISKGAETYFSFNRLTGLKMDRRSVPKGWVKPDSRGMTRPKAGTPDREEMDALPSLSSTRDIFGDSIIDTLLYEGPDIRGSEGISARFFDIYVGWAGERYFALIPHARNAAMNHMAKYPDRTILGDALGWNVPLGLREVSKAEVDLAMAQHRVDRERAAAAAVAA